MVKDAIQFNLVIMMMTAVRQPNNRDSNMIPLQQIIDGS